MGNNFRFNLLKKKEKNNTNLYFFLNFAEIDGF